MNEDEANELWDGMRKALSKPPMPGPAGQAPGSVQTVYEIEELLNEFVDTLALPHVAEGLSEESLSHLRDALESLQRIAELQAVWIAEGRMEDGAM